MIPDSATSSGNIFFFLMPFQTDVWILIVVLIVVIAFLANLFNKLSPYGKFGRKIHAQQTCACEGCKRRRELKAKYGCRFEDTKEFDCAVEEVEDEDVINDMNFYNSVWVVGTGKSPLMRILEKIYIKKMLLLI